MLVGGDLWSVPRPYRQETQMNTTHKLCHWFYNHFIRFGQWHNRAQVSDLRLDRSARLNLKLLVTKPTSKKDEVKIYCQGAG